MVMFGDSSSMPVRSWGTGGQASTKQQGEEADQKAFYEAMKQALAGNQQYQAPAWQQDIMYNQMNPNTLSSALGGASAQMMGQNLANQQASQYSDYLNQPLYQEQIRGQNQINLANTVKPWEFATAALNPAAQTQRFNTAVGYIAPLMQQMLGRGGITGYQSTNTNQSAGIA